MHVLHGSGVDDVVHAVEGALEALAVAHVTDEVADGRVVVHGVLKRHLVLLLLVPRKDDELLQVGVVLEEVGGKRFAQRARATGNEYRFTC